MRQPVRKVREVVSSKPWVDPSSDTLEWLASLLQTEGVDLMSATFIELQRGTPVYVDGEADVVEVQRLMARNHIRSLPVTQAGRVIGIIDLLELAMMDQDLPGIDLTDPVAAAE
ncbi:MAG: CBS domain-containing protein [Actinomycetota bacterium]